MPFPQLLLPLAHFNPRFFYFPLHPLPLSLQPVRAEFFCCWRTGEAWRGEAGRGCRSAGEGSWGTRRAGRGGEDGEVYLAEGFVQFVIFAKTLSQIGI